MKTYKPTILVIQDKAIRTNLIQPAFKKIGVTDPVHYLSGGRQAIAYMMGEGEFADRAKFAYPTFVLTDLHMSDGDGFSVLEFLKTNPEWGSFPPLSCLNRQIWTTSSPRISSAPAPTTSSPSRSRE
jgi:CheY-like chemotaxis protein